MEQMVRNTFSIRIIVSASSCRKVVETVSRTENSNLYLICVKKYRCEVLIIDFSISLGNAKPKTIY